MGQETVAAMLGAGEMELVGAYDRSGGEVCGFAVSDKFSDLLEATQPDVAVDFTHHGCSADLVRQALSRKVATVIGTSGLSPEDISILRNATEEHGTPAILVPNFAIGAVLMMKFAADAARYMPSAEVIEMHHDNKLDAPSGTASHTAHIIGQARQPGQYGVHGEVEKAPGARGGEVSGVRVHSVRLPGFVASQEVLFGAAGERLSLRHDSIDRKCFMAGVLLAVRNVRRLTGWNVGLDAVMD